MTGSLSSIHRFMVSSPVGDQCTCNYFVPCSYGEWLDDVHNNRCNEEIRILIGTHKTILSECVFPRYTDPLHVLRPAILHNCFEEYGSSLKNY